jgi:hypothetical protein
MQQNISKSLLNDPYPIDFNYHQGHCKICRHPKKEEIEKILLSPNITLQEFTERYNIDKYVVKDTIFRHLKATGLDLTKRKIADSTNYFLEFELSREEASVDNKLRFNEIQQRRENKYADTSPPVLIIDPQLLANPNPEVVARPPQVLEDTPQLEPPNEDSANVIKELERIKE